MSRPFLKITYALWDTKTGPVRDIQQTSQCVYSIVIVENIISARPLEVCIKEHIYDKKNPGKIKNRQTCAGRGPPDTMEGR